MKKVIRLSEADLTRIVKRVIKEQASDVAKNVASVAAPNPLSTLITSAVQVSNGSGTSDQKIKQFCDLCKSSNVQITQKVNSIANTIRTAVQGVGTDENEIYNAVFNLKTFDEFCSLVKAYQQSYKVDLYDDLDSDIDSEDEWVVIFKMIREVLLRQQRISQNTTKPTSQTVAKPTTTNTTKPTSQTVAKPTTNTTRPTGGGGAFGAVSR